MEKHKDIFDHLKPREIFTPDQAYFNQLAKNVVASAKPKVIPLYRKPLFWITATAASLAVILLLNLDSSAKESDDALLAMNDIPQHELLAYIKENIKEFDTEMLSEVIPAQNIEKIATSIDVVDNTEETPSEYEINFENIQQEDILNYLQDEDIDLSDLEDLNKFNH